MQKKSWGYIIKFHTLLALCHCIWLKIGEPFPNRKRKFYFCNHPFFISSPRVLFEWIQDLSQTDEFGEFLNDSVVKHFLEITPLCSFQCFMSTNLCPKNVWKVFCCSYPLNIVNKVFQQCVWSKTNFVQEWQLQMMYAYLCETVLRTDWLFKKKSSSTISLNM